MQDFNFYIPLQKDFGTDDYLNGVASTVSIDRDGERMSDKALADMQRDIMSLGVNLFGNHEHSWENTLGVIKEASNSNNQLNVKVRLDDPSTNPKIPMLLNKLKRGIKLGLSIGGKTTAEKWEYSKELGKKVKVIDGVKLYEVSVVGIPSNSDSFISIPTAISKSIKKSLRSELDELRSADMTTSDLQGAVSVIARRYGVSEDEALGYVYGRGGLPEKSISEKSLNNNKCPVCFNKLLSFQKSCELCLWSK